MEKEMNLGELTSVKTPLIQNEFPAKGRINKFNRWSRSYVYIWAAGFLACVCGLLFGYQLAIIGGALLQLRSEFCLGILQNEVSIIT